MRYVCLIWSGKFLWRLEKREGKFKEKGDITHCSKSEKRIIRRDKLEQ